jgi:hypothetical protein
VRAFLALLVFLAGLLPATGLRAHALDPVYLELKALGGDSWSVLWRVPATASGPMPLALELPAGCEPAEPPPLRFDGRAFVAHWVVTCPTGIRGGRIDLHGLETTRTDALVRFEIAAGQSESRRLTPAAPGFDLPEVQGRTGVLRTYGALGVNHILQGIDHLLFVFLLLLVTRDGRKLVAAVTAFTVAHSLTLAAAALGWFVVPAPPVEAVVALSIMFLAAELVRPDARGLQLSQRFPWAVAFGFGLLHGLGFARALLEIGLPQGEVPLALLAFNLGVELGQILFILLVVVTGRLLARLYPVLLAGVMTCGAPGARAVGYAAGGLAGAWFVSRIAAF